MQGIVTKQDTVEATCHLGAPSVNEALFKRIYSYNEVSFIIPGINPTSISQDLIFTLSVCKQGSSPLPIASF